MIITHTSTICTNRPCSLMARPLFPWTASKFHNWLHFHMPQLTSMSICTVFRDWAGHVVAVQPNRNRQPLTSMIRALMLAFLSTNNAKFTWFIVLRNSKWNDNSSWPLPLLSNMRQNIYSLVGQLVLTPWLFATICSVCCVKPTRCLWAGQWRQQRRSWRCK